MKRKIIGWTITSSFFVAIFIAFALEIGFCPTLGVFAGAAVAATALHHAVKLIAP